MTEYFKNIPKWVNLSFGYGADGMIGEFQNKSYYNGKPIPTL